MGQTHQLNYERTRYALFFAGQDDGRLLPLSFNITKEEEEEENTDIPASEIPPLTHTHNQQLNVTQVAQVTPAAVATSMYEKFEIDGQIFDLKVSARHYEQNKSYEPIPDLLASEIIR